MFKLTYDIEHRFEEHNKSGNVLADLTTTHDSQLYGTEAKRITTAFDLLLLLLIKFFKLAKYKECVFSQNYQNEVQ